MESGLLGWGAQLYRRCERELTRSLKRTFRQDQALGCGATYTEGEELLSFDRGIGGAKIKEGRLGQSR